MRWRNCGCSTQEQNPHPDPLPWVHGRGRIIRASSRKRQPGACEAVPLTPALSPRGRGKAERALVMRCALYWRYGDQSARAERGELAVGGGGVGGGGAGVCDAGGA